jgi:O-antigen/teichoic acid export membrane protein
MQDADAIPPTAAGAGVRAAPRPSLFRNVLSNWASTLLLIIYALVITPVVVRALDRELYGIWSFLNGLVAYSNLFYLGLGAALVRFVAEHHASGDRAALNRLASVVLSLYVVIGLIALGCMILAAPYVPRMMAGSLAPGTARAAVATAVLLGARLLFMFVASAFSGVVVAEGRMDLFNLVGMSGTFVRFAAVPLVVRTTNPLLALAATVVVTSGLETAALAAMAFHVDPELRVRPVFPRAAELRMLYGFGFFSFLLQIGERLISYTDTTVIGFILGASSVALYALPLQLAEYARIAVSGIVSVLTPHLTGLYTQGKHSDLRAAYLSSIRLASFVSAFLNVNLVFLGTPFLRLWVGPAFADAAPVVLLALGVTGFLQSIATQSQWPFCLTLRTLGFPVTILLLEALVNLALSIALARPFGIGGVAVGTAVPALFLSGLLVPPYVARRLGLTVSSVVREGLVPSFVLVVALVLVHWPLRTVFSSSTYIALVAKGLATVPVAVLVAFVLFPESEREAALATLRRTRSRIVAAIGHS